MILTFVVSGCCAAEWRRTLENLPPLPLRLPQCWPTAGLDGSASTHKNFLQLGIRLEPPAPSVSSHHFHFLRNWQYGCWCNVSMANCIALAAKIYHKGVSIQWSKWLNFDKRLAKTRTGFQFWKKLLMKAN